MSERTDATMTAAIFEGRRHADGVDDYDSVAGLGREGRRAGAALAALCVVAALSASVTALSGAVVASGAIVPDGAVKKIQHAGGGTIASLEVHDGSRVVRGQTLLRLDRTVATANLAALALQADEMAIHAARIEAELADAKAPAFPAFDASDLGDTGGATRATMARRTHSIEDETKLFDTRRRAQDGRRDQIDQRLGQYAQQVTGLQAQAASKREEIALIDGELSGVRRLYDMKLVAMSRYTTLERDRARLSGEAGQLAGSIAEISGKVAETRLQKIQLDDDWRNEDLKDLRETQAKMADLDERAIAARDTVRHVAIESPVEGVVSDLAVHTIGGVVAPGEAIMTIVPLSAELVVEAKVQPTDIDSVHEKGPARVKFAGLNPKTTPELEGTVSYVGADVSQDHASGAPAAQYYRIRVVLPKSETAKLHDVALMPGMPAEVLVPTKSRTILDYLTKPLREQLSHTMNER